MRAAGEILAGDDATPLTVAGRVLLWLLRLAMAPASTLTGFRRWLLAEAPAAPRGPAPSQPSAPALPPGGHRSSANGKTGKQDLLIALAAARHDLRALPLNQVAQVAGAIAADIGLHPGTARRVLRTHVRAVQAGAAEPAVTMDA